MESLEIEIIWSLDRGHDLPMDIIRYIMTEWISYHMIEDNQQFRECIKLWFDKKDENQEERKVMIKKYGHISYWNTKNITDMSKAFSDKRYNNYFSEDLSQWNVSNVLDMSRMFYDCSQLSCDLSQWNVSKTNNMRFMFSSCINFTSNLSQWNVSQVTNMSYMFRQCHQFNCNLSQWDVSNVQSMDNMFYNCIIYDCDISNWNIQKVLSLDSIFTKQVNRKYQQKIQEQWKKMNPNITNIV